MIAHFHLVPTRKAATHPVILCKRSNLRIAQLNTSSHVVYLLTYENSKRGKDIKEKVSALVLRAAYGYAAVVSKLDYCLEDTAATP